MKKVLLLSLSLVFSVGLLSAQESLEDLIVDELKRNDMENVSEVLGFDLSSNHKAADTYNKLSEELFEVRTREYQMIRNFLQQGNNVTDKYAEKLIDEWVRITEDRLKVMKKFPNKMKKHLSASNTVRLMQYENKKQALIDTALAKIVPFAN